MSLSGDLAEAGHCRSVVTEAAEALGGLDLQVNNVAFQNPSTTSLNSPTISGGAPSR